MTALELADPAIAAMKERLTEVSGDVVAAVVAEVPSYRRAFSGPMGETIQSAVELALEGFLDRLSPHPPGETQKADAMRQGSYDLGRGEARSGRTTDALLSAYRVGARVAWLGLSGAAVGAGLSADQMAAFADGVFAYIDELSALSVAGHNDELETTGRVQERLRERLARLLLTSAPADAITTAARRAEWPEPSTLTALVVAPAEVRSCLMALGRPASRTLVVTEDVVGLPESLVVLLVPDADRAQIRRSLAALPVALGPVRPWFQVPESFALALRAADLRDPSGFVDADDHLAALLLSSDPSLRADLRARVLAPLDDLRPQAREKLEETLRAWLLCQGRRDDVAEMLFVHPQTVRYRMTQIRDLFGDRLNDPNVILDLVLALG
ncbi:MAG TPA: helix-turn-helix domain-containing protein [Marmoricola sp.]|nr:helix-turn-helix domain-containing protein [Marmoricola sp.]